MLLNSVITFSDFSGLKLNHGKCQAFFSGVSDEVVHNTLQTYGFSRGILPITYLGLPLITSRLTQQLCSPLISRLCQRIEGWSARVLRYSGRLQLITSVLQGIQGFWSMYLFLPKNVLKSIQSILAKFLWRGTLEGNCHYNVAWADCCFKKQEGGLGVRDLFEWNKAAILLQVWKLSQPNPNSIWILWVHSCLLKRKAFWTAKIPYKCPWNIRKILNARNEALRFISYQVSSNSCFKLWHDPWLTSKPLVEKFGEDFISVMDSTSYATVGSIIVGRQWTVAPTNDLRAIQFRHLLSNHQVSPHDLVLWNGNDAVNMSVIWDSLRRRGNPGGWQPLLWHKFHIPACSFIFWLACRDRLLTKDRMDFFQMNVDLRCVLCHSSNEDSAHLFTSCPYSYLIMKACPFDPIINWQLWMRGDFFSEHRTQFQQNVAYLYITVAIYLIWKERNYRIHNRGAMSVTQLGIIVKRMVREKLYSCSDFRRHLDRDPTISHILY